MLFIRAARYVGALELRKNWGSHIDASHSRQPLVKGERLVRHEVNAVMAINARCCRGTLSAYTQSENDNLITTLLYCWQQLAS